MTDDDDDDQFELDLEFILMPQCKECKHWWPNLHHYKHSSGSGTCDITREITESSDDCDLWEDAAGKVDWWYFNGDSEES